MSRLPTLRSSQILLILHHLGFRSAHGRGSHVFLEHPDGRATVVPVHKGEDIGRGLLRKILRDIKMEPEEFAKLL